MANNCPGCQVKSNGGSRHTHNFPIGADIQYLVNIICRFCRTPFPVFTLVYVTRISFKKFPALLFEFVRAFFASLQTFHTLHDVALRTKHMRTFSGTLVFQRQTSFLLYFMAIFSCFRVSLFRLFSRKSTLINIKV